MVRPTFRSVCLGTLILVGSSVGGPTGGLSAQETKKPLAEAVKAAEEAGIPSTTLSRLLAFGYENGVEPTAMAGFLRILTEAQQEAMPLGPFLSKTEEGLAKRVPTPVIQTVLARKLDDYRSTRSLMVNLFKKRDQALVPPEYQLRLTEALSSAPSREDLVLVLEQAPPAATVPMMTRAAEVMASLEQNGFDSRVAQSIVLAGLNEKYFASDHLEFSRIMVLARQKGIPEHDIATTALKAMQQDASLHELSEQLGVTGQDLKHGPLVGAAHGRGRGHSPGKGGVGAAGAHHGDDQGHHGGQTGPGGSGHGAGAGGGGMGGPGGGAGGGGCR